jgi:hypothetical protein
MLNNYSIKITIEKNTVPKLNKSFINQEVSTAHVEEAEAKVLRHKGEAGV